jgi:O-antigen ligase
MNHSLKKNQAVLSFIFYFYVLFFISLVFSFRFINSISIAFILLASFILNKVETGRFYNSNLKNPIVVFTFLFYLFQFAGLLYTHNLHQGWSSIRIKSSLVAIPLALSSSDYLSENTRRKLLRIFYIILLAAILYCLFADIRQFRNNHDTSVFFYHSLVHPISQHAIQFSILIFIALVSLFENLKKNIFLFKKNISVLLIGFFSLFIFLLSSKLVIAFYLLYLLYFFLYFLKTKNKKSLFIIAIVIICSFAGSLVIMTRNPISQRFTEILHGDLNLITQEKFGPANYFNGLQFRLLQWRFVTEILNEKNAWLAGVSPGDAQRYLNEKYISENMYIGTPERGDKGFLGYNTHNQFLEALLQTGLIGLLSFLMICFALIKMAWQRKRTELSFITILLLAYSFSESVFETQYSLLIFLFFPLFFYLGKNGKSV